MNLVYQRLLSGMIGSSNSSNLEPSPERPTTAASSKTLFTDSHAIIAGYDQGIEFIDGNFIKTSSYAAVNLTTLCMVLKTQRHTEFMVVDGIGCS